MKWSVNIQSTYRGATAIDELELFLPCRWIHKSSDFQVGRSQSTWMIIMFAHVYKVVHGRPVIVKAWVCCTYTSLDVHESWGISTETSKTIMVIVFDYCWFTIVIMDIVGDSH